MSSISPIRDTILLERSRCRKSTVGLLRTVQFVLPVGAHLADATGARNPFDACSVSDFPEVFDGITEGNDNPCSFVTDDLLSGLHRRKTIHRAREICPRRMDRP